MKLVWLLPIGFLLTTCGPTKEQAVGACHIDALKTYPQESAPYSFKLEDFEKACMAAKGFRFDAAPSDCGHGDLYEDANCYKAANSN